MLDKDLAKKLYVMVNSFQEELAEYATDRINTLHKLLEIETDTTSLYQLQGQIKELRRLLTLRQEVIQDVNG